MSAFDVITAKRRTNRRTNRIVKFRAIPFEGMKTSRKYYPAPPTRAEKGYNEDHKLTCALYMHVEETKIEKM